MIALYKLLAMDALEDKVLLLKEQLQQALQDCQGYKVSMELQEHQALREFRELQDLQALPVAY